ncbi:hypothetical protein QR680_014549 [Steinernema hermaphroditum]|uniref:RNase III domain-containing protein n=1 Tax=Steinernema hermaphroditum TaxID=289476 RepID=A0AA39M436_9BILA|nr:hypothetical protein QR680_014549 [Steinernema hermaphroditum]
MNDQAFKNIDSDDASPLNNGTLTASKNGTKERHLTESETFKRLAEIDLESENSPGSARSDVDTNEFAVQRSGRRIVNAPCEDFYEKTENGDMVSTHRLRTMHEALQFQVLDVIEFARRKQPQSTPPEMPEFHDNCKCGQESDSEPDEASSDEGEVKEGDTNGRSGDKQSMVAQREIARKQQHPAALSPEMCFNESGQMNDGPVCKCSWASRKSGIRHGIFAGEDRLEPCDPQSSNLSKLYHYFLKVTPDPAGEARRPSRICHNDKKYYFEGFSVFFHRKLPECFPQSSLNKVSQEFDVVFLEEQAPEHFTVGDLEGFQKYLFDYIMEQYDLNRRAKNVLDGCPIYHCLPRFTYKDSRNEAVEVLPMSVVLQHIVNEFQPAFNDRLIAKMKKVGRMFDDVSSELKGQVFVNPSTRPAAIRADLIDRPSYNARHNDKDFYPLLTHFGLRPTAYTLNSKPAYQKENKKFLKLRHLLSLKPKVTQEDKEKLRQQEELVKKMKVASDSKRDICVSVSSRGFYRTAFYPDIIQHAMLLMLACSRVRYHWCLETFERRVSYTFKNRTLLELAMTHPSFKSNYGTNPDHVKNTMLNCGLQSLRIRNGRKTASRPHSSNGSGDRSRKRGYENLCQVMSMKGSDKATTLSPVHHNERLEFLGDSVIEFITTIHLFYMMTDLDEGALATYRSSLVQNKHLALLAKKIGLEDFMLYSHGPDLCHESDFGHAMANAFEAMFAAVYLDGGLDVCDRIFGYTLFKDTDDKEGEYAWHHLPEHPLKRWNPHGDRHMIPKIDSLQLLCEFEDSIGIKFKHIRVLAKAFTRRCIGYNNLTHGHNQRLEFLGDTVLQLVTTDYLYKHFPNHHEGHLSLLRTCLVCNRTQGVICDDLAMARYLVIPPSARKNAHAMTVRWKERADLVESFLGALYVDRGLKYCRTFCEVCFFPRLKHFIESQRWNDPKSQLQQNCIALRDGKNPPEIPEYKVIAIEGPTNTRLYRVGVYFRGKRLADGSGHTIHVAQMNAAENALKEHAIPPDDTDASEDYSDEEEHAPPPPPPKLPKTPEEFRNDIIRSASLRIAAKIMNLQPNDPMVLSPLSIAVAMGTLQAGSGGDTKNQINDVVFGGCTPGEIDRYFANLLHEMNEISIGTAVFVERTMNHKEDYSISLASNYGAHCEQADFVSRPQEERVRINQFVEEATNGQIKEIVGEGVLTSSTRIVVASAIHMAMKFACGFSRYHTKPETFHFEDGSNKEMDMMQDQMSTSYGYPSREPRYLSTDDFEYGDFCFKQNDYRFFLLVPRKGNLSDLTAHFASPSTSFSKIVEDAQQFDFLNVTMPKFKSEFGTDLKAALNSLGVVDLFTEKADLRAMTDGAMAVSCIAHKVIFDVDEDGVVASAVTGIFIAQFEGTIYNKPTTATIVADRPFLYGVTYKNTPLFVGQFYG